MVVADAACAQPSAICQAPLRAMRSQKPEALNIAFKVGIAATCCSGAGDIPSSGLGAVAMNVTAVGTEANDFGGFVTVCPCGDVPDSSNLNFVSGQTIPNSVIAPVSADGKVCFYVYGKAHLLADVSGYLPGQT